MRLSLRGLLYFLWHEAELTRWHPGFTGKRTWSVVRSHLLSAARNMTVLEFHQHVDVTVGAEIVPKDGAEQRQPRNVMSLAERRHRVAID